MTNACGAAAHLLRRQIERACTPTARRARLASSAAATGPLRARRASAGRALGAHPPLEAADGGVLPEAAEAAAALLGAA